MDWEPTPETLFPPPSAPKKAHPPAQSCDMCPPKLFEADGPSVTMPPPVQSPSSVHDGISAAPPAPTSVPLDVLATSTTTSPCSIYDYNYQYYYGRSKVLEVITSQTSLVLQVQVPYNLPPNCPPPEPPPLQSATTDAAKFWRSSLPKLLWSYDSFQIWLIGKYDTVADPCA